MTKSVIKILLIEDNPADVLLLREFLAEDPLSNFQVTVAEQLGLGLAKLGGERIDVLLLDLGLPDSQGLKTFATAHGKFPQIPIVVLSGMTDELLALQAVQAGAQDYLVKSEAGWKLGSRAIRYAIERHRSQAAMRASEARFSTIFRSSPIPVAITRIGDNRILEVNEAWLQITGYRREEAVGRILSELNVWVYPEERQKMVEMLRRGGRVSGFEFQMRRRSGEIADLLFSAELIELGGEPCMLSMAQDITERKLAEAKIAQTEKRSQSLIENAPDGIVLVGLDGKYKYASPAALRIFNYKPEDISSANPNEQTHPDDLAMVLGVLQDLIANPSNISTIQYRFKHQNGAWRWIESTFTNLLAEPTVEAVVINFRDITERKQAEKALRDSEEKFRNFIEQSTDGLMISDEQGVVIESNHALENINGIPREQALGMTVWDIQSQMMLSENRSPENLDVFRKHLQTATQTGQSPYFVRTYEAAVQTKSGERKIIQQTSFPIKTEKGYRIGAIIRDVTERKQAEEALRKSLHSLEEAERISHVGHYEIDVQSGKATWSQEVFRIFGIDPAEGEPTVEEYDQLIHPQDSTAVHEMFERSTTLGTPFDLVYRILRSDGQIRHVHSQAETVRNEQGQVTKLFGTFQDITGQRQAEEKLQSAHEFLQRVQDSLSAHIAILDQEGNIVQVNSAWRGFGYYNGLVHPNHCIGANYLQVCDSAKGPDSEEAALAANAIRKAIGGEENETTFEYTCHSPGEKRWFIARTTRFENGGRKWVVVSHENITTRRQAEEVLRQRITEIELLYENSLAFTQSFDPREIAQKIIELLGEKLDWHHTAIRLVNPQDNSLELAAFDEPGLEGENTAQTRLSRMVTHIGEGLSGWALQQSRTLRIGDVTSDPHYVESYPGIHSGLYVPLKSGDRALGVISIESEKPNAFSETDEQFIVTLANQAAIALENARLYREISRHAEELEQRVRERTAEIEATRRRLELAVTTAGIGIWELDVQTEQDYWDDRLFALYGISKETTPPSRQTWHNVIHPDDLEHQAKIMDAALFGGQSYNAEFRVIWPDQSIHYIKSTGIVVPDEKGLPVRMIGANQDITTHKQAEETLRLANAEMERGLRMKNEFLANMSHELRTPLNAILGISESLEEQITGALNEKQLKYVRIINESGRHLLEMINDILDLSKIEAGKLELDMQPISVEKLCASSLRMIKELAHKKPLEVSFKMDETVKTILGDERRLKQSLVNLLGNAVKFTPPGKKIGLEVSGNAAANEVMFTVWDEGIGIEEEDKERLFKPFVQLNASLTREYAGTGLGLALVAQMARLHGGHVTLTSEPKVGSRFTMTLPWKPAEQEVQTQAISRVPSGRTTKGLKRAGKILIVDDTEIVLQLVSDYLRFKGYETLTAGNGQEAVLLARNEHPQVILMDVMMPVMDGLDAARQIRADPVLRNITIIGLTALAMPSDRDDCLAAGMNDHLSKPVQMQELLQKIQHYLPQTS